MRLSSPILCAALAALLAGELALAKPKPMQGKPWRVDQLEDNKADEEYQVPGRSRDSAMSEATRKSGAQYMPQADAYQSAAEQAVYLQAYQMSYGPYGNAYAASDPAAKAKRDKLIKETAQAIDDCVNGRPCGPDAQQKVLQALVQHNFGQELRRLHLTNSTNRENMRSLVMPNEKNGESYKAFEVMKSGSSVARGQRKNSGLSLSSGSARDPYYQLDRTKVEKPIGKDELEALGPKFLNDYGIFVRAHSGAKKDPRTMGRYYKFVEARPTVYTYDPSNQLQDSQRLEENIREQNSKPVQDALAEHLKTAQAPAAAVVDPKKPDEYAVTGERGQMVGFTKTQDVYKNTADGKKDLSQKVTGYERYAVIADDLNRVFKETAEKKNTADGGRGLAQSGASSFRAEPTPKDMANNVITDVTLSPDKFDAFLNEIWPSSAERQKIIKGN